MGFWRSIDGEGEGGSHGGLRTQQEDQSQEGKANKESSSCTCVEDRVDYGKKKLWVRGVNKGGDLEGWRVW